MEKPTIVGIDFGTTKVCTLVAEIEEDGSLRIIGVGIEPSRGMKRGVISDLTSATESIVRSVQKAQRTSAYEIRSALVSLAGTQVSSVNSVGPAGVSNGIVSQVDVNRAMEAAQAIAIPHNREIIHVIQRGFTLDGQENIHQPIGMNGYRLEVEAHIITAAAMAVENLRKCVEAAGIKVSHFVLNPLASAEVVLRDNEREVGVMVCDIGGGTTDLAIYINSSVWHTMVIQIGGDLITSDIAHGLRLSLQQAEEVKIKYGHASQAAISNEDYFNLRPFGEETAVRISRKELAIIIEARMEEIFNFVLQEIRRSGYDSLLPAGVVLTGGCSLLPGIQTTAREILGIPVRIAKPENLVGLVDQLDSPAYSTSVGLLNWSLLLDRTVKRNSKGGLGPQSGSVFDRIKNLLGIFTVGDQGDKQE
jgi:cell division protein FtsA